MPDYPIVTKHNGDLEKKIARTRRARVRLAKAMNKEGSKFAVITEDILGTHAVVIPFAAGKKKTFLTFRGMRALYRHVHPKPKRTPCNK